jgi:hypothetical protein
LIAAQGNSYPERVRKLAELDKAHPRDEWAKSLLVFRFFLQTYLVASHDGATDAAVVAGTKCLVALKRWQVTNRQAPTDLAAVCGAAGLPAVPTDPFSGALMRMTLVNGEPVVYSIGSDGVDDKALKTPSSVASRTGISSSDCQGSGLRPQQPRGIEP